MSRTHEDLPLRGTLALRDDMTDETNDKRVERVSQREARRAALSDAELLWRKHRPRIIAAFTLFLSGFFVDLGLLWYWGMNDISRRAGMAWGWTGGFMMIFGVISIVATLGMYDCDKPARRGGRGDYY